jgi:4-hydroxybenzoate polyprenyltransferase
LKDTRALYFYTGFSRLKLFLALSRTPHGLLDMCTPALCALLWLGGLPPLGTIMLGLVTTFAGYTAVYALNDVVDYRVDRRKVQREGFRESENYLDALLVRHPMAHGYISYTEGIFWMLAWSAVALCGAYLLNPVCILIFIAGCALEVTYCLLLKVSHLRVLVSGGVKTSGGVAAIFAVDPHPAPAFVVLVFFWLFFWEIGGQNVPNDWADIDEDRHQNARTLPVRLGPERATDVILVSLALTLLLGAGLFSCAPGGFQPVFVLASVLVGAGLLIHPALRLYRGKTRSQAIGLFNRASYYPPALLLVVLARTVL